MINFVLKINLSLLYFILGSSSGLKIGYLCFICNSDMAICAEITWLQKLARDLKKNFSHVCLWPTWFLKIRLIVVFKCMKQKIPVCHGFLILFFHIFHKFHTVQPHRSLIITHGHQISITITMFHKFQILNLRPYEWDLLFHFPFSVACMNLLEFYENYRVGSHNLWCFTQISCKAP